MIDEQTKGSGENISVVIGLTEALPPETEKSLGDIKLLQNVDPEAVTRLEEICTWYFCPKGGYIFDSEDTSGDVCFIVSGGVRASNNVETEIEVAFVDLEAGDLVGELSAIDNGPRSATVYALEDCILAIAPKEVFLSYMRNHSDVLVHLMLHLVITIRNLNTRVVGLSSTTVVQRVYEELLKIAEDDPVMPNRMIIEKMPKHKEVAVWAGTTPETVARAVGRLLEAKIAMRRFKTLHILDPGRLKALVDAT